jgi:hypothetical protein
LILIVIEGGLPLEVLLGRGRLWISRTAVFFV